jgi:ketosteroid isomerase-like protein
VSVADELFTAIEKGDVDAVRALYAPDIVVWHNTDGIEQTAEQNLRILRWLVDNLADRSYDDVRRRDYDGGFVQQHVLRFTYNGTRCEIPACIVASTAEGHITRIDEYLDSAHISQLVD